MADYKKVIKDKKLEAGNLMNDSQLAKCNGIIHTASVASGVVGAVPIFIADAIPISAAQVTMVITLGKVFGQKIEEAGAKSIIAAAASTFVGRSFVKLIPIVGWEVSAVVAAGVTEAIGWTVALDFAKAYRQEYLRQQNAKEAADAYAKANYYKKKNKYEDSDEEAEDFSDID
ncbi:hypothetical protein [Limosilactobacillus mucosae]|uniref:hypothetical protein n=1 Tax=Limosilactobacillus mucosae TaxID=97478 RepID=UPI0022E867C2|nr:hypothetical protein [Limosilactobacillus mucosae]